jgi:hypothetical protein
MFNWIGGFFHGVGIVISGVLISFAGFISPTTTSTTTAPVADAPATTTAVIVATTTVSQDVQVTVPKPVVPVKSTPKVTPTPTPIVQPAPTPAPAPVVDNTAVVVSNVRAIPSSAFSTTISWTTNIKSDGKLTYWAKTGGLNKVVKMTSATTNHQVDVATSQDTTYSYVIEVTAPNGTTAASDLKEFTSLSDANIPKVVSTVFTKDANGGVVLHVLTSEPTTVIFTYNYINISPSDDSRKVLTSNVFTTDTRFSIPAPQGWSSVTMINYSLTLTDESNNDVTLSSQSKKYSEI